MDQLDDSQGNGYRRNTKISHLVPLFKSYYKEETKYRTKPKTPTIALSEDEEQDKNKGEQNEYI